MKQLHHYFSLKGKVAVVTGVARSIGAHTSCLLAAAGARVAVLDARQEEGEIATQNMGQSGAQIRFWQLDIGDKTAVQQVFNEIEAHFGRIDILVNSAGMHNGMLPTQAFTREQWEQVMRIDTYGAFLCTLQAVPAMERVGGGAIVNLTSMCCIFEANEARGYHASIKAVRMMTKADALQYGAHNIRVNSVHPGFIRTPTLEAAVSQIGNLEVMLSGLASFNPMRRIGSTGDVAAGILYLVSDASRFVTGTDLVIDGGYICRSAG